MIYPVDMLIFQATLDHQRVAETSQCVRVLLVAWAIFVMKIADTLTTA